MADEPEGEDDQEGITNGRPVLESAEKPLPNGKMDDAHICTKLDLQENSKYAYARLCCIIGTSLFPSSDGRHWVETFLKKLIKHIDTPLGEDVLEDVLRCPENDNDKSLHISMLQNMLQQNQDGIVAMIPKDLIMFSLNSGCYDARNRLIVYCVGDEMELSSDDIEDFEDTLVIELKSRKEDEEKVENERRTKEEKSRKLKRNLLIGLGTIAGATVIGLTGGLAAPLIAAGAGAVLGGGAAVLATAKGLAVITALFGAAGAGLTGYRMKRRLGDMEQFEFEKLTEGDHLHLSIMISGWLEEDENGVIESGFRTPWTTTKLAREQYCLKWESKYLGELGNAISSLITTGAIAIATEEAIKHTILQGIFTAIAWPLNLLKLGYVIDNPWSVCAKRSAEVGRYLAKVLMDREQGYRPVSLIGFSFGARVIFHCLKALCEMKGSEGIVQQAILLGAPVTADASEWNFERVVAGRIVNGYCRSDWLLKFAYRTASAQITVAGLQAVGWANRRMVDVDLSDLVHGHGDYAKPDVMKTILKRIEKRSKRFGALYSPTNANSQLQISN